MILPTKHLSSERALLTLGADILNLLSSPKTVSSLWDSMRFGPRTQKSKSPLAYSWFILALDLLYMLQAIEYENGVIIRRPS